VRLIISSLRASHADFPRARAIGRHHNPLALHLLYHSGCTVVSDPESALNHRNGGLIGLQHDSNRFIVHFIDFILASRTSVFFTWWPRFEDFHLIVWGALLP